MCTQNASTRAISVKTDNTSCSSKESELADTGSNQAPLDFHKLNLRTFSKFAAPLIFTAMASHVMLFCDRLILAKYNIDAMNAASMIGNFCAVFQFGLMGITAIAEVFVGQYNGSNQPERVRTPVWQMVWLSLFSFVLTIPIAIFGLPLAVDATYQEIGAPYFYWMMSFVPLCGVSIALASFFIGRGQAIFVTCVAVISNILNFILNIILVFGVEDIIPAYGIEGSAIATVVSSLIHVILLLGVFLRKPYREVYKTHKPDWNWQIMKECWRIGVPNAIQHLLEIIAWTLVMRIVAMKGSEYLTVSTVGQTIFFLAAFFNDGLSKATSALSANYIGAKLWDDIQRIWRVAVTFHVLIMVIISSFFVIYPDFLIYHFIPQADPETFYQLRLTLIWVWLFSIFDGITWIFAGILTSGGDTKFIMVIGSLSVWIGSVLPIYLFLHYVNDPPAHFMWGLTVLYAVVLSSLYAIRYKSGRWKKLILS